MEKIIVANAKLFRADADQAGSRECFFGLLEDVGKIAGVECRYHADDDIEGGFIATSHPELVISELNNTGDWGEMRPNYTVID